MDTYDFQVIATHPEESVAEYLCPEKERICRYCNRTFPEVRFTKIAHLIPQLLGNENMICEFECDTCNKRFGKKESDLANYLGMLRTMQMVEGKKGIPAFTSPDNKTKARKEKFHHAKKAVKVDFEEGYTVDREKGLNSITYEKQPYTPITVYKCFYKMAMAIMDEDDCILYTHGLNFLTSDKNDGIYQTSTIFSVIKHSLPDTDYPFPILLLCKKKKQETPMPTHTMIMFYRNAMFQLFLPFCASDEKLYGPGIQINLLIAPPFVFVKPKKEQPVPPYVVDNLSSAKQGTFKETIYFSYDPEIMKNAVSVDMATLTKSSKPFDETNVVGMYIINANENFELKINPGEKTEI